MEFFIFLKQSFLAKVVLGLCSIGILGLALFLFMRMVQWDRRKQRRRLQGERGGDRRHN